METARCSGFTFPASSDARQARKTKVHRKRSVTLPEEPCDAEDAVLYFRDRRSAVLVHLVPDNFAPKTSIKLLSDATSRRKVVDIS